jgi:hypothetical protein
MLRKSIQRKRKGSVLVEYGLLLAGIVVVSVVAIAVLGHKISDQYGVAAAVLPGAHLDDNKPIAKNSGGIPFVDDGTGKLVLDAANLVSPAGVDRMAGLLGPGGGELLIVE